MAKGFIPVYIAAHYFPTWFALIVALAALLGHMYSVFLRGGGGKGVATGAGIVLALVPWIFIIALCVFLVFLLTTRMVSVASMAAALTFAICTIAFDKPIWYEILAVLAALVVIFAAPLQHRRIALRCENKVTFPWDHDRGTPGSGRPEPAGPGRGSGRAGHRRRLGELGHRLRAPAVAQRPRGPGADAHGEPKPPS